LSTDIKKICSCGYTIDSPMISIKTRYSKLGWFMLSLFFSVQPLEVIYQCQQCGTIIDKSRNPEILKKYRYNSDVIK